LSYALRNTIVLGVMLLIILAIGIYFLGFHYPSQASAITKSMKQLDAQLQNTPDLVNQYNEVSLRLNDMEKRWSSRSKDIPTYDATSQTYAYLNRIMDLSGFVKMDMVYTGVQNKAKYGYNIYNLKGEGTFENLYRFLWYIENGRRLYKIKSITLKGNPVKENEDEPAVTLVVFEIELHAFFTSLPELASSIGWRDTIATPPFGNPFLAAIAADLPPNTRGLVEVERSDLKAIIPGKAFVLDQTGIMRSLTEGDEVYLGYVSRIFPEQGRVEFTLNKAGIVEQFELRIRFESSTTK
jgi:hypothetical protein